MLGQLGTQAVDAGHLGPAGAVPALHTRHLDTVEEADQGRDGLDGQADGALERRVVDDALDARRKRVVVLGHHLGAGFGEDAQRRFGHDAGWAVRLDHDGEHVGLRHRSPCASPPDAVANRQGTEPFERSGTCWMSHDSVTCCR